MKTIIRDLLWLAMVGTMAGATAWAGETLAAASSTDSAAATRAEMEQTMEQVRRIVNQPVTRLMGRNTRAAVFDDGWFHEGAGKPDFNNVDVRTTQQLIYDKYPYVTSKLNAGVVFMGPQLEFNPNTKYFYADLSLPKKKLTEAEMLEINRLYRIIGRCEQKLGLSGGAGNFFAFLHWNPYVGGAIIVVLVLLALFKCVRRGSGSPS
ncbi:MAG: hypothetical protein WA117_00380 [Verrucomicrobiia bacterium]